jgi:hypothetical protein
MSVMFLYVAVGLPALALLMAAGTLVLTKRSHDRFKDALLAEQRNAASS